MNNQTKTITVKTRVIAGALTDNHNAVAVKSSVKAGIVIHDRKGR